MKQAYNTTLPGSWSTGGYDILRGDWATRSRLRLAFQNLEGQVFPYESQPDLPEGTVIVGDYWHTNSGDDNSAAENDCVISGATFSNVDPLVGTHKLVFSNSSDIATCPTNHHTVSQGAIHGAFNITGCGGGTASRPDIIFYASSSTASYSDRMQAYLVETEASCRLHIGWGGSHSLLTDVATIAPNTTYYLSVEWSGSPSGNVDVYLAAAGSGPPTKIGSGSYTGLSNKGLVLTFGNDSVANPVQDNLNGWMDGWLVMRRTQTSEERTERFNTLFVEEEEPPPPPPPPTELSIEGCEIGAVSNTRVVSTLPALNPGETYDPELCTFKEMFTLNQNITEFVPSVCNLTLPGGPLMLDFPNAPADDTVQVQVFWQKGTINEVASPVCTNTVTVPLPPKAALVQLPGWRFEGCGLEPGGLWHGRAGQPLRPSSPTNCLRIRVAIGNLSDTVEEPPSRYAPWISRCNVNEACSEFQRMANEFGTLGIRFTKDATIEQEQATTDLEHFTLRPVGGVTFTFQEGGRYQAQNITSSDVAIQPQKAIVQVIEAQLAPNLPLETRFKFCMRQEPEGTQLGEALENCEDDDVEIPVSIIVDRGFVFGG